LTWLRRVGFALLGVVQLVWGGWAYAAPRHFFGHFPGRGHQWTAAYPPYNEHLVADLGATFLALGALLLLAAIIDDRRVTLVVVVGEVLFSALHLGYHAAHRGGMAGDYAPSLVALAVGVVAPPLLLLTYRRG
jgi:hypothetical protein